MEKTKNRFAKTYTKKLTRNVLIVGIISGNVPYVLSAFGCEPVESLGKVWVVGIVAVCLGYFVRGFKDTKEIADDDYRRMIIEREAYDDEN